MTLTLIAVRVLFSFSKRIGGIISNKLHKLRKLRALRILRVHFIDYQVASNHMLDCDYIGRKFLCDYMEGKFIIFIIISGLIIDMIIFLLYV